MAEKYHSIVSGPDSPEKELPLHSNNKDMASKKTFKKDLNRMIFDVVEECFSVQLFNESKKEASDKLIDEAVDFRNGMTEKIHAAKTKKEFKVLHAEVEDAAVNFIHKINGLY